MPFLEDAALASAAVTAFLGSPSSSTLAALQAQKQALQRAVQLPPPAAAERERLRSRTSGVPQLDSLPEQDVAAALQLSDRLRVGELFAGRLLAEAKAASREACNLEAAERRFLQACGSLRR